MSYLIVDAETALTEVPTREDGTVYPFVMLTPAQTVLADTRTELVATLIGGYDQHPEGEDGDDAALLDRYRFAVQVAGAHQQVLAAEATEAGTFNPAVEKEETLTAIFSPRDERVLTPREWSHPVTLVLVAFDYAPYTGVDRPTGNVLWLDPHTETSLLEGLAGLGALTVVTAPETVQD
ncbi:hypothetical protein V6N00_13495 [Tersicoccus sp. MR15.9]|uniref:hypothetical protein n=1 Tax=Tersicoccus mangrovi TaxID=3121635 RepID=UPI002FE528C6